MYSIGGKRIRTRTRWRVRPARMSAAAARRRAPRWTVAAAREIHQGCARGARRSVEHRLPLRGGEQVRLGAVQCLPAGAGRLRRGQQPARMALGELERRPHLLLVDAARDRIRVAGENTLQDRRRQRPAAACLCGRAQGPHSLRHAGGPHRAGRTRRARHCARPKSAHSTTFEADRLICTIPFPALRGIEIAPAFSPAKRRVINELAYDYIVRTALQCRTRYWEKDGFNGFGHSDTPQQIWHFTHDQPGPRGLLVSFLSGPMGEQGGRHGARRRAIASSSTRWNARIPGSRPTSKPCT